LDDATGLKQWISRSWFKVSWFNDFLKQD